MNKRKALAPLVDNGQDRFTSYLTDMFHKSEHAKKSVMDAGFTLTKKLDAGDWQSGEELIVRLETAYDPKYAVTLPGVRDNISRRFIRTKSYPRLLRLLRSYNDVVSFHEVMTYDMPVKIWFDLDDYKNMSHDLIMESFSRLFIWFMQLRFQTTITKRQFNWLQSHSATKNSLHLVISGFRLKSNRHMKFLAQKFVAELESLSADDGVYSENAFLDDFKENKAIIDLAVYRRNGSIRMQDSAKLSDPTRLMIQSNFHSHRTADSIVSCCFDDVDTIDIEIDDAYLGGPDQGLSLEDVSPEVAYQLERIVATAFHIVVDPTRPAGSLLKSVRAKDEFWFYVVLNQNIVCQTKKDFHSHNTDNYLIVSLVFPFLYQCCHSPNCFGKRHEVVHNDGLLRDLWMNDELDAELSARFVGDLKDAFTELYTSKNPEAAPKDTKDAVVGLMQEHKVMDILFKYHYNKFLCAIRNEAHFMIGVHFKRRDPETGQSRICKRVVAKMHFLDQYASFPYIRDWILSPVRRDCDRVSFFPFDKTMIKTVHPGDDDPLTVCMVDGELFSINDNCLRHDLKVVDKCKYDFNMWSGLKYKHDDVWERYTDESQSAWAIKERVEPFTDHIRHVWCNDDPSLYQWTIQWLASIYKRPWHRLGTAIILQGGKGAGKGIIVQKFAELLGDDNFWQIGNINNLTGTYTHPNFGKSILGFVDEAYWGGDPKQANALKGIITEKRQDANVKYQVQRSFNSYLNIIAASNNRKIVEVTPDNRRYQFMKVKEKIFENERERRAYFDRIGNVSAMDLAMFFLTQVCLCTFNPSYIFKSDAAATQLMESFDPLQLWWYSCLCGTVGNDCQSHLNDEEAASECAFFDGNRVAINTLRLDFMAWCSDNKIRFPNVHNNKTFMHLLKGMVTPVGERLKMPVDAHGQRLNAITLPNINNARLQFDAYCKHRLPYDIS